MKKTQTLLKEKGLGFQSLVQSGNNFMKTLRDVVVTSTKTTEASNIPPNLLQGDNDTFRILKIQNLK